jgi:hypothetical protein
MLRFLNNRELPGKSNRPEKLSEGAGIASRQSISENAG